MTWVLQFLKRLFCRHPHVVVRKNHGAEINVWVGKCSYCGARVQL